MKIKAIFRIICSKHFYLITADKNFLCKDLKSENTDQYSISKFLQLYWVGFYKGVFCSKPGNEKYI